MFFVVTFKTFPFLSFPVMLLSVFFFMMFCVCVCIWFVLYFGFEFVLCMCIFPLCGDTCMCV